MRLGGVGPDSWTMQGITLGTPQIPFYLCNMDGGRCSAPAVVRGVLWVGGWQQHAGLPASQEQYWLVSAERLAPEVHPG